MAVGRHFTTLSQQPLEDLVIDGGEIFAHVALQHVRKTGGGPFGAIQRLVRPHPHAAGIRVLRKAPLEDRFQNLGQGVMHNPVPKRRGRNETGLGLVYAELAIRPRAILPEFNSRRSETSSLSTFIRNAATSGRFLLPSDARRAASCRLANRTTQSPT